MYRDRLKTESNARSRVNLLFDGPLVDIKPRYETGWRQDDLTEQDGDLTNKAVHVRIEGRVQGVWYRGWTTDRARDLGLSGWVRNRADGSVEAVFAGPTQAVDAMLEACWKGPPAAQVSAVKPQPCDAPESAIFQTRPTA